MYLKCQKGRSSVVPTLLDKLRNYDSHLFIKTLLSNTTSYIKCEPFPTTIQTLFQ